MRLSWVRSPAARLLLPRALTELEELSEAAHARPGVAAAPADGPRECVVCMAAPRATRYRCGHCLCCEACTRLLERCPSCRVAPIRVVARGASLALEESFVEQLGRY